jgi:hypothetical protein
MSDQQPIQPVVGARCFIEHWSGSFATHADFSAAVVERITPSGLIVVRQKFAGAEPRTFDKSLRERGSGSKYSRDALRLDVEVVEKASRVQKQRRAAQDAIRAVRKEVPNSATWSKEDLRNCCDTLATLLQAACAAVEAMEE